LDNTAIFIFAWRFSLILGNNGASPHGILLHLELNLAVRALAGCYIIEALDAQNISKINSLVDLTARAGAINNLVIGEKEIIGDGEGALVDWVGSEKEEDEGVETDERFDELKSKCEPSDGQDSAGRKVEQVASEVVLLHGNLADAGVDVALRLGIDSELRSFSLELRLQSIELVIAHDGLALHVGLGGGKEASLLTVQNSDVRTVPCQIFLEEIELLIVQHLSAADIV